MDILEIYDKIIASLPNITRKGKATPYTSTNGYMFTFITKEKELAMRFSHKQIEDIISQGGSEVMQHGKLVKDFVLIPRSWLVDSTRIAELVMNSFDHTNSLKPK